MNATQALNSSIDRHLQTYLKLPQEARGVRDATTGWTPYDRLADDLARAAMDYASAFVKEKLTARRQVQGQERRRR